jgi:hypothetical protein
MVRLAGFLTGSMLAIGLILVILGVPQLRAPEQEPVELIAAAPAPEPAPQPVVASPPAPQPRPVAPPEPVDEPEPELMATHWHSFWTPFGSRIAADGFVSRLETVTGFDYRVIKIDNGVYEVAFAYTDAIERDAMLAAIASTTGLELPGS